VGSGFCSSSSHAEFAGFAGTLVVAADAPEANVIHPAKVPVTVPAAINHFTMETSCFGFIKKYSPEANFA
jgi:hypothetical protein